MDARDVRLEPELAQRLAGRAAALAPLGSLSVEFSIMVTLLLFQPTAFGRGETEATVTGGIVSVGGRPPDG